MRQVPSGGGSGTLSYLLADQVGTTTAMMATNGTISSSAKYWLYGNVRTGGVSQTNKLYTGQ